MSFVFVLQLGRIRPKSAKRRTTVKRITNARNRYAGLLYHFSSFFFIGHPALFSHRPWFTPDIVFIYHISPYLSTLFPVSLSISKQETLQLHWRVSCLYVPICYSIDLSDSAMLIRRRRKYITKSTIAANSTVSNSEYTTLIGAMRTSKAIMSTLICDMT